MGAVILWGWDETNKVYVKVLVSDEGKLMIEGGLCLTDYHYYASLAAATTYTPTANSKTTVLATGGMLTSVRIHSEFWDGALWVDAMGGTAYESSLILMQDTAQNTRIHNGHSSAQKISLTGVVWS